MAKKLPEIPKCKVCGSQILGSGGGICRVCQLKRAHEDYQKVVRAEESMSDSNVWMRGYSPWKNILVIPLVIVVLIAFVIFLFLLFP